MHAHAQVDLTLNLVERKTGGLSCGGGISSQVSTCAAAHCGRGAFWEVRVSIQDCFAMLAAPGAPDGGSEISADQP
jgi:hypothetical protein